MTYTDGDVHHKDKLNYSGGKDTTGELCYDTCVSNDLTQMLKFLMWIPDCETYTPALFLLRQLNFLLYMGPTDSDFRQIKIIIILKSLKILKIIFIIFLSYFHNDKNKILPLWSFGF